MSEENIQFAGDVKITKCSLSSIYGEATYDITPALYKIEIYEDLFSNSLSGNVTVVESLGLFTSLPIIGEELLEIEFYTPTLDQKFTKMFAVYKLSDRVFQSDKKTAYVLHFMSVEAYYELDTKINRAFSGSTSEIAKNIFDEYIQVNKHGKSIFNDVEQSGTKLKYVSNYWSPFKNMNYIASRSTDLSSKLSGGAANFMFYESRTGFKFKSINSLLTQKPFGVDKSYRYDFNPNREEVSGGQSTRDVNREYWVASRMVLDESVDYITRMMSGAYSNTVIEHNLRNKSFRQLTHSYKDNFKDVNHIGAYKMCNDKSYDMYSAMNGVVFHTKSIFNNAHGDFKDKSADTANKRLSHLAQLEMFKIKIDVPGRTDIEVGNVINFELGKFSQLDASDKNSGGIDEYYSGKYLVTSILHTVTQRHHQMTMTLVKDAIEKEYKFGEPLS